MANVRSPDVVFTVQTDAELLLDTPIRRGIELEAQSGGGAQEPYNGPYVVTPTREAQTLPTRQRNMGNNIIVEGIPKNWGEIGWDGSVMTIT